jgi:xylulokinase
MTIASLLDQPIEIYNTTGAIGAARAASLTNLDFDSFNEQVVANDYNKTYEPSVANLAYKNAYQNWKKELEHLLKKE